MTKAKQSLAPSDLQVSTATTAGPAYAGAISDRQPSVQRPAVDRQTRQQPAVDRQASVRRPAVDRQASDRRQAVDRQSSGNRSQVVDRQGTRSGADAQSTALNAQLRDLLSERQEILARIYEGEAEVALAKGALARLEGKLLQQGYSQTRGSNGAFDFLSR